METMQGGKLGDIRQLPGCICLLFVCLYNFYIITYVDIDLTHDVKIENIKMFN